MPELPEVETIRRQLEKEIVGKTIADVWYDRAKMLRPSPEEFVDGVVGKEIVEVRRRGKLLVFELVETSLPRRQAGLPRRHAGRRGVCARGDGGCFVCHLRLSGRLLVRRKDDKPDDYVHVVLKLQATSNKRQATREKGQAVELRFAEARQFGYMEYLPNEEALDKVLSKYGPEPLDNLTADKFYSILQKTRRAVKTLLLDQGKISGVGNIYANDALFLAKIHPQTPANKLTRAQSDKLLVAIEKVFKEGLKYGGASDQWYRQVHGEKGSYQEHFRVYGRAGEKCDVCGAEIERIDVGGRGTFFCPRCQKK